VKTNPFEKFAKQTSDGVYHAIKWDVNLPDSLVYDLIEEAKANISRKARLCLHPDPSELLQFTYLAFASPYKDKIHSHPNRPELIYPIFGSALHSIFDSNANLLKSTTLNSEKPVALGTPVGKWHSLEVQSDAFVMLEIGTGPFSDDSTVELSSS
jgi:cupin fold WbuC family metalloprotein